MSTYPDKVADGVLVEHYCCVPGCKEWGGFGFARNKSVPVQWWCWEHYPYKSTEIPNGR